MGDWTADVTYGEMTVSWMVNGNSPMVAYSIQFFVNDFASTLVYDTGKLTDGCPFYGVDYAGNPQFFSCTLDHLGQLGFNNGEEYKYIITQWWGDTDAESVTQSSAAVFVTRAAPTLTMGAIANPVAARSYTFTASYSQAEGDALNWVRWELVRVDTENIPLADTGKIYGTAQLQFTYDGFFRGNSYAVRCTVQTENGVEATTDWNQFVVSYETTTVPGALGASRACGRSAVLVEWPGLSYIPGSALGTYSVADGLLTLGTNASVSWTTVNGADMEFPSAWTVLTKFTLNHNSGTVLNVATPGTDILFAYSDTTGLLSVKKGSIVYGSMPDVGPTGTVTAILTNTDLYLRVEDETGGLVPRTDLYPGTTLYPGGGAQRVRKEQFHFAYYQQEVSGVTAYGPAVFDYIEVMQGTPDSFLIDFVWGAGAEYTPSFTESTLFLADFSNGLNAGPLSSYDPDERISIYRQDAGAEVLLHVADTTLSSSSLYDYGAASQQGPYSYQLLLSNSTAFTSSAIESNEVSPCFWDWSLLSCTLREGSKTSYEVEAEYRFGKNLSSGQVGNNNSPFVAANFTRYPTVQASPANWKSGTLQSLIGAIDYAGGQNEYSDSLALRDAIYNLSTTSNTLFLKSRKGDLMMVRIAGQIQMETMDGTREQAQQVSLPWVEVGSADGLSLTVLPGDGLYTGGEGA
jgi:hypothetical protein